VNAHFPLQSLRPLPGTSLSNVYKVMPFESDKHSAGYGDGRLGTMISRGLSGQGYRLSVSIGLSGQV